LPTIYAQERFGGARCEIQFRAFVTSLENRIPLAVVISEDGSVEGLAGADLADRGAGVQ
jgi:hypothetical protein